MSVPALLELEALAVHSGETSLVEGFSFVVQPGRVHALVGESGSGKTLSMLALLQLLPKGLTSTGQLRVDGATVAWGSVAHGALRGRTVSMMVQDASSALDPVMRVGRQIDEALGAGATSSARDLLLKDVGFESPAAIASKYPHELSGGMRQRVLLAATLAAGPKLLVADEPTTALDAAVRGGVLALLKDLATTRGTAIVLITHDLDAARAIADEVTVLYAGRVAEQGPVAQCLEAPRHPYTAGLLGARPRGARVPEPIPGSIPAVKDRPAGCRFQPRCLHASAQCRQQPPMTAGAACFHPLGGAP